MATGRITQLRAVLRGAPGDLPGTTIHTITRRAITAGSVLSSLVGAALVVVLLALVLPLPLDPLTESEVRLRNAIAVALYVPAAIWVGVRRGHRIGEEVTGWLVQERTPTERERRRAVAMPLRLFAMQLLLWSLAAALFAALNAPFDALFGFQVGITVLLSGMATASIAYLLAVRFGRAIVARALADEPPQRFRAAPGILVRAVLAWALGTMIPVAGALVLAAFALGIDDVDRVELARSVIVLSAIALVVGLLATVITARSVADPLRELRHALLRVERGDLDAAVAVNDASEVGYVQAGFNRMVAGLRERERLRDLFGRHVGQDVAQRALREGVTLGGEEREAAALFVDVVGSTGLATRRPPTEVVQVLNAFFAVVVAVTREHGGLVNKFEGDGALCVFGAPLAIEDPAGAALAAARSLARRLEAEVPEVHAAVGVSAGTVVAGNVGAADRFEYTVIGDPVNEAARLTEQAKALPGRVCASGTAVDRARDPAERERWTLGEEVVLRGRDQPTCVAVPSA